MKIFSKIYTQKGQFRFVFSTYVDASDFNEAELSFNKVIRSLFGECMYQIYQIEK